MVGINLNLIHIFYKIIFKFFKYVNNSKKSFIVNRIIKFGFNKFIKIKYNKVYFFFYFVI